MYLEAQNVLSLLVIADANGLLYQGETGLIYSVNGLHIQNVLRRKKQETGK